MRILSAASAFPPHFYDQETLSTALRERWGPAESTGGQRLERLHRNTQVAGRHLALPLEDYPRLQSWGEANDAWIRVATDVAQEALTRALASASLPAGDLEAILFTSVTGLATPSIDARLCNRMALSPNIRRIPMFGLGCVAGAAGLARTADHLRGFPDGVAALVAVELCSLTLQPGDHSMANAIATGLFGDGGAAVIVAGKATGGSGPRILDSRSVFYRDTEEVMGWKVSERGLGVRLSAAVPDMVRRHVREDVDRFLSDHGLHRDDVKRWICHPGGPRVLEAMQDALELPPDALQASWDALRRHGNVSSVSVLLVLEEALASPPPPGSHGLALAMGPGFCSEMVLLHW